MNLPLPESKNKLHGERIFLFFEERGIGRGLDNVLHMTLVSAVLEYCTLVHLMFTPRRVLHEYSYLFCFNLKNACAGLVMQENKNRLKKIVAVFDCLYCRCSHRSCICWDKFHTTYMGKRGDIVMRNAAVSLGYTQEIKLKVNF